MPKITLGITGLYETCGRDYGIEESYSVLPLSFPMKKGKGCQVHILIWGSFRAVSLISSRQFEFQVYKLLACRVEKLRNLIKSSDCALFLNQRQLKVNSFTEVSEQYYEACYLKKALYSFAQILPALIMLCMGYNIMIITDSEVFVSEPLGSWLYLFDSFSL